MGQDGLDNVTLDRVDGSKNKYRSKLETYVNGCVAAQTLLLYW